MEKDIIKRGINAHISPEEWVEGWGGLTVGGGTDFGDAGSILIGGSQSG